MVSVYHKMWLLSCTAILDLHKCNQHVLFPNSATVAPTMVLETSSNSNTPKYVQPYPPYEDMHAAKFQKLPRKAYKSIDMSNLDHDNNVYMTVLNSGEYSPDNSVERIYMNSGTVTVQAKPASSERDSHIYCTPISNKQ